MVAAEQRVGVGSVPGQVRGIRPQRGGSLPPHGRSSRAIAQGSIPAWCVRGRGRAPAPRSHRQRSVSRPALHLAQPRHNRGDLPPRRIPSRTTGWSAFSRITPCRTMICAWRLQRQMISITRHQHMGDQCLDRDATLDQPRWRGMPAPTVPVQARQASFGRLVTIASQLRGDHIQLLPRCPRRSPSWSGAPARAGGLLGCQRRPSIRGRCCPAGHHGSHRRLAALSRRNSASRFSASASPLAIACSRSLEAQLQLVLGQIASERAPNWACALSCSSMCAQPVILSLPAG